MLRTFTVFNQDQVEGELESFTNEASPDVEQFINKIPFDLVAGSPAFMPSLDQILIPPLSSFDTADSFYSTLFHELTHWTGHQTRSNRDLAGRFGDNRYAAEELIAELGSAFTCSLFEMDNEVRHAGYIAS